MPITPVKKTLGLEYILYGIKSYTGYKKILIDKLKALLGVDGTTLFADVYGVNNPTSVGYPACWVLEQNGKGQIIDTHRNEREWQFAVVIHQSIGSDTMENSAKALTDAVDKVINSFDRDPMLLDSNGQSRCKFVRVLPIAYEYATDENPIHRALLNVAVVDLVNRY